MSQDTNVGATQLRGDLRDWVAEHWNVDASLSRWRTQLADSGWATPSWPVQWGGRGIPEWADDVVADELAALGVVGLPLGVGISLAAPTILAHGPDNVRARLLRPILTGEHTWCQLFSEPGSGSDLAGLSTRAMCDGDRWTINGQKLWSTSAHHADYGLLLARTDLDAPKHRGITCFALPMAQPGVEVRSLRQMNGHASFNEVFLSDAVVDDVDVIGTVNEGWRVAMTTLAFERRFGTLRRRPIDASRGRALHEAQAEADAYFATYAWYPQRAGRVDLLVDEARRGRRTTDPVVRQQVAAALSLQRAHQWAARRAQVDRAEGRIGPAVGSLGKLGLSVVARAAASTHSTIAGATAMLAAPDGDATIAEVLVSVPAQSIAGGTDEVQHNIVGEQLLGLPREPSMDRDIPYRDIRR